MVQETQTFPRREALQALLEDLLGSDQVHFQPPTNIQMEYPAIVYDVDEVDTKFADNLPFRILRRYQVKVIARKPEHPVIQKISALPRCVYVRWYPGDNLNHDVFNIYF